MKLNLQLVVDVFNAHTKFHDNLEQILNKSQ